MTIHIFLKDEFKQVKGKYELFFLNLALYFNF